MHLLDKATLQSRASELHSHGMQFRPTTRRRLLRCHMEFEWGELKQHSYADKIVLNRILLLVKPFGMERVDFDPVNRSRASGTVVRGVASCATVTPTVVAM